jgi:hypothetical protein
VVRFQFHRSDGGGTPMCYSITPLGLQLANEHDGPVAREIITGEAHLESHPSPPHPNDPAGGERLLRQARHDVRAAGWALAVERVLADGLLALRGPDQSAISPPSHSRSPDRAILAPPDLRLPGGRTPHDFLRTVGPGRRVQVERFQSVRPDVTLSFRGGRELLVELDDRLPEGLRAAKLERYDHFLAGWSTHLKRYARADAELPLVVFVCRDRSRARECARRADHVLTASRAYAGEYPSDWDYPGREHIAFAAERDAHEGVLRVWGAPRLPPDVRVAAAGGDPRGRDPLVEQRLIPPGAGASSLDK